jgi:hypothetical protein
LAILMRALPGIRWPLNLLGPLGLCCFVIATAGCTWGSQNGVPWWGSKKDKEEALADVQHYGPFSRDRIALVKEMGDFAAKGNAQDKQRVADRLATDIVREADPMVRVQMVRTLATIPNETAAGVLMVGIKDPDSEVRVAVCQAWGKRVQGVAPSAIADPTRDMAVRVLAGALSGDTNIDVRLAAARQLGHVKGDPRAVGALGIALKDPDPAMQVRTVASLRETSGHDFGNDVGKWQQYVDSVAPMGRPQQVGGQQQIAAPQQSVLDRR